MAKELVRLGASVSVFTIDWRSGPHHRNDDDGVWVCRVDPRQWYPEFLPVFPFVIEPPRSRLVQKIRSAARIPGWGPFKCWGKVAFEGLLARHASVAVDVAWAIHGDATSHEVAFRFSAKSGVPWVADFKDPWDQVHQRGPARWLRYV